MKKKFTVLLIFFSLNIFGQCWQTVAGGSTHSIGIKTDGTLWSWGLNNYGQLGDGTTNHKNTPTQIGVGSSWQSVSCGYDYSVAIKSNGTLWGWGYNYNGQLGVNLNPPANFIPSPRQIGTDNNWQSVSAGTHFIVAKKIDGTIWAMGNNGNGALGDGTYISRNFMGQIGLDNNWENVSVKGYHTIAKKTNGTIWTWGLNNYGQLGDGTYINKNEPTQIGIGSNWQNIAAGYYHTIAIKSDGTLWTWGYNYQQQLGDGTNINKNVPIQIGNENDWQSATGGYDYTIIKKVDGTIRSWGSNYLGQLSSNPSQLVIINDWQIIACGHYHNLYIKNDGSLWTWGPNWNGQLGDGTNISRDMPVMIQCPISLNSDNFEMFNDMVFYPNPVKDSFKIENAGVISMIKIYDTKGAIVRLISSNFSDLIDISNLRQGIYLLSIIDDEGNVLNKRIIKD